MKLEGQYLYYGDDLTNVYKIREQVFQIEQNINRDIDLDYMDAESIHVIVYMDNTPVSTGRLFIKDKVFKIGRLAVLKDNRGNKLGDFTARMLIDKAFLMGADEIIISAQLEVKGFYERLGFLAIGDIVKEANIDHIGMVLKKDLLCKCCNKK